MCHSEFRRFSPGPVSDFTACNHNDTVYIQYTEQVLDYVTSASSRTQELRKRHEKVPLALWLHTSLRSLHAMPNEGRVHAATGLCNSGNFSSEDSHFIIRWRNMGEVDARKMLLSTVCPIPTGTFSGGKYWFRAVFQGRLMLMVQRAIMYFVTSHNVGQLHINTYSVGKACLITLYRYDCQMSTYFLPHSVPLDRFALC